MSSIDFDPSIKLCLKFLHSSEPDSTEQLRLTLDEYIRQTHGTAKTLGNVLPKKYLNEEKLEASRPKPKVEKIKTVPVPQQSPQQLQIPERDNDDTSTIDGELAFDLLHEDLTCVVCRLMAVQAGNQLVECDTCHALYHQDCHNPVISDMDKGSDWQCTSCLTSQGYPVAYSTTQLPVPKSPTRISGTTTPVKMSSSSSSSSSTSSSSKTITPTINIVSADKRLQIMKKKAAKQHEKKKHK